MPVGALVLGRRAMQADLWMPDGSRRELDQASVISMKIDRLAPHLSRNLGSTTNMTARFVCLTVWASRPYRAHVAVVGLGGIGSLLVEYLSRLGVGHFTLVDDDTVEAPTSHG